jgi:hypothetical protein
MAKLLIVVVYLFVVFRVPEWLHMPATPITAFKVICWGSVGLSLLVLAWKLFTRGTRSRA